MKKIVWLFIICTSLATVRPSLAISKEFLAGAGAAMLIPNKPELLLIAGIASGYATGILGLIKLGDDSMFKQSTFGQQILSTASGICLGTFIKACLPHWQRSFKNWYYKSKKA